MATSQGNVTDNGRGYRTAAWIGLTEVKEGTPAALVAGPAVMQVVGSFGTGGHVTLKGSVNGVDYVALKDAAGAAIDLTAAGLIYFNTLPPFIKPVPTAGTTVLVDCYVAAGQ